MRDKTQKLTINNDADFDVAGGILRELLLNKKLTEKLWCEKKSTAYAEHRRISGLEGSDIKPIHERMIEVREAMAEYFDTETASRHEEMILWRNAQVAKLRKAGLDEEADDILATPIVVQEPSSSCVNVKRKLDYRVVAPEFIDDDFMKVDDIKVRKAVQEFGEMAEKIVGGIETFEVTSISVKRGANV